MLLLPRVRLRVIWETSKDFERFCRVESVSLSSNIKKSACFQTSVKLHAPQA